MALLCSSYDQDLWETLGEYSSRDAEESLQLFRLLREANLQMFDQLTPSSGSATASTRKEAR